MNLTIVREGGGVNTASAEIPHHAHSSELICAPACERLEFLTAIRSLETFQFLSFVSQREL